MSRQSLPSVRPGRTGIGSPPILHYLENLGKWYHVWTHKDGTGIEEIGRGGE